MNVFIKMKDVPRNILLVCRRSDALFPIENIEKAIGYWKEIQESIQKKQFSLLWEHLEPFTGTESSLHMIRGDAEETESELSCVKIGITTQALFFRSRFMENKDFAILGDMISRTIDMLPQCEEIAESWYEETQKFTTPEHSFDLGYDLGKF